MNCPICRKPVDKTVDFAQVTINGVKSPAHLHCLNDYESREPDEQSAYAIDCHAVAAELHMSAISPQYRLVR